MIEIYSFQGLQMSPRLCALFTASILQASAIRSGLSASDSIRKEITVNLVHEISFAFPHFLPWRLWANGDYPAGDAFLDGFNVIHGYGLRHFDVNQFGKWAICADWLHWNASWLDLRFWFDSFDGDVQRYRNHRHHGLLPGGRGSAGMYLKHSGDDGLREQLAGGGHNPDSSAAGLDHDGCGSRPIALCRKLGG